MTSGENSTQKPGQIPADQIPASDASDQIADASQFAIHQGFQGLFRVATRLILQGTWGGNPWWIHVYLPTFTTYI